MNRTLYSILAAAMLVLPAFADPPPATAGEIASESKLNIVALSEQAQQRLGIETAPVEQSVAPQMRLYAGTVSLPPGASATVAAPAAGTVVAVLPESAAASIGAQVDKDTPVLWLLPFAAAEEGSMSISERGTLARALAETGGRVAAAHIQADAARIALGRAEQLLRDKVGSQRAVDEAQAALALAERAAASAQAEQQALAAGTQEDKKNYIEVRSPIAGVVQSIAAVAGEVVSAGQILVRIESLDTRWVTAWVYPSEVSVLNLEAAAEVFRVGAGRQEPSDIGTPVPGAALPADPITGALPVLYALPTGGNYRAGERVTVQLAGRESAEQCSVPASAILYDIHGDAYVYREVAARQYARKKVNLSRFDNGHAFLARPLAADTRVVTAGAAELFGFEFGNDH